MDRHLNFVDRASWYIRAPTRYTILY